MWPGPEKIPLTQHIWGRPDGFLRKRGEIDSDSFFPLAFYVALFAFEANLFWETQTSARVNHESLGGMFAKVPIMGLNHLL